MCMKIILLTKTKAALVGRGLLNFTARTVAAAILLAIFQNTALIADEINRVQELVSASTNQRSRIEMDGSR